MIIYFAYGSNMLTERLKARAKDANELGIAHASGWRLTFHKVSTRKNGSRSGKCDIRTDHDPKAIVYGVLYEIPEEQFYNLNECEKDYSSYEIIVHSPKLGVVMAVAHVADNTDATLAPYDW
jgi:cation transport regulator ChaC